MSDFTSGKKPVSAIKQQGFTSFLSNLFGWRKRSQNASQAFKSGQAENPLEFVSVDLSSKERLTQSSIEKMLSTGKLSSKLDELFNSWLNDTSDSLQEIVNRAKRVDQLTYARLNDPFINRVAQLYADEGTQLDVQDRIIGIDCPDPRMAKEMYALLDKWGITQQRCRSAIEQLAVYGDCFWANAVSDQGVEKIIPLKQLQISDRLEFNPVDALEKLKRKEGFAALMDKHTLLKQMLSDMDTAEDFAELFNTKLFGYVIQNDMVVPPWSITHFRVNADGSEFYPFGASPLLGCLAPFKLAASTITLQSIARVLNFPITLYKVKTSEAADEARQFQTVNRVREEYDNIGVSPSGGNSEVYTVNTKIWMPDGLMDVDVKSPGIDIGFVEDIEMYQDRVAVASGVPKGYLIQEWGGAGNSAISLVEQYKPFARAVYSLQAAFLDGLSNLFRLHFAINGRFDFRVPFTLSLKYPAEEISDEKQAARTASLEMASAVIEMVRAAIGAGEEEPLSPDITRDIISKYTFLDPVDIVKWTRDASYFKQKALEAESEDLSSEDDFDLDSDMSAADEEAADGGSFDLDDIDFAGTAEESVKKRRSRLKEARFRELSKRYKEVHRDIYFKSLVENSVQSFVRGGEHVHRASIHSSELPILEALQKSRLGETSSKLREYTLSDMLKDAKDSTSKD